MHSCKRDTQLLKICTYFNSDTDRILQKLMIINYESMEKGHTVLYSHKFRQYQI